MECNLKAACGVSPIEEAPVSNQQINVRSSRAQAKGDVSTLSAGGHFYFALTGFIWLLTKEVNDPTISAIRIFGTIIRSLFGLCSWHAARGSLGSIIVRKNPYGLRGVEITSIGGGTGGIASGAEAEEIR